MMHRLLSWGLLLLFLFLVYLVAVHPLVNNLLTQREALQQQQQRLALTQHFIENAPLYRQALAQAEAADSGEIFLPDDQPELAAAHLQRRLKDLIERSGARYQSASVQQAPEEDARPAEIGEVRVRASFVGDADAVLAVLFEIEAGRPLLYITNANISRRAVRAERSAPPEIQVMVNLEVAGLFWQGAP